MQQGVWDEFLSAPAADAADGFRIGPLALGAAQDAGEAAQRRAFLKWTQGEAMTAQEKALVDGLWNTDPHRASEYWAAGEFLDTEVLTSSALDGGGLDGTMGESSGFQSSPFYAPRFDDPKYTHEIKWGVQTIKVRQDGPGFWGERVKQHNPRVDAYEWKINPHGESYYLPHSKGGYVQFENMVNSVVQDGKLILKRKSFYHIEDMPRFAKEKVLKEAQRQLDAANAANYTVEWLVSDKDAVRQLQNFFTSHNVNIKIRYYPE